jgi:hypothetical protein
MAMPALVLGRAASVGPVGSMRAKSPTAGHVMGSRAVCRNSLAKILSATALASRARAWSRLRAVNGQHQAHLPPSCVHS